VVKVKINFKSGKSLTVKCKNFTVNKNIDNSISELKWDNVVIPKKILYFRLDSVESIIQI